MPPRSTKGTIREWRITLARAKGQYLGRVEAPDAETAIEEAIKAIRDYGITDPERQRRLVAQRIE